MSKSKLLRSSAIVAALFCGLTARLGWSAESSRPAPSANEAKIIAALDEKTELEFVDQPLSDIVEYLRERHDIEIQLDNRALTDEGIGSDTPVTRNIKGIGLESALGLMLGGLDLTFVVRDDVMFITSKTEAENWLSTKTYPVADLIVRADDPGHEDDYQSLIALITASVAPQSWNSADGPGSVSEFRNARALVISQTFAVHREIERLLAAIREVRQEQAAERPTHAAQQIDDETPYVKVYRLPEPPAPAVVKAPHGASNIHFPWHVFCYPAPAVVKAPHGAVGAASQATPKQAPAEAAAPADAKPGDKPATKVIRPQPPVVAGATVLSRYATAKELADAIPAAVAPESWADGRTAIRSAGNSLIVRQTRPVHREIARLLEQLK
ncbi:MAG TPA: hypothetical protein VMV10_00795 [Pirellulales bacterium]|nr:hypothetical protein [Pirellulales bacterium]